MPDEPTALGLLALLLLLDARRGTRVGTEGRPVLLADQDRSRWDADKVREGVELLGEGLRRTPDRPDAYVVQAALAACHALAPTAAATDWTVICSWYDVLVTVQDTPATRLARAVAIGERDGARAGLAAVDAVVGHPDTAVLHAARAELLRRSGQVAEGAAAYDRALRLPLSGPQRRQLEQRRSSLALPPDPSR